MAEDYTQDKEFLAAPPEMKHKFLLTADPDYAQAPAAEQQAFLATLGGGQKPPSAIRQAYTGIAEPATAGLAKGATMAYTGLSQALADASAKLLGQEFSPEARAGGARAGARAAEKTGRFTAEALIPQSPEEAAIALATGGAGRLAGSLLKGGSLLAKGGRVASQAAGGALGGGTAAALTGDEEARGEALKGSMVGGITGMLPGGRPGAKAARGIADVAESATSGALKVGPAGALLHPERSLSKLVIDTPKDAQRLLGQAMEATTDDLARFLPAGRHTPLTIDLGNKGDAIVAKSLPTAPQTGTGVYPLTIDQAHKILSDIGTGLHTADVFNPTLATKMNAELYKTLYQQIIGELSVKDPTGAAAKLFAKGQNEYRAGNAIVEALRNPKAFEKTSTGPHLNVSYLQEMLGQAEPRAQLQRKLGDKFKQFERTIMRGARPGQVDEPGTRTATTFLRPHKLLTGGPRYIGRQDFQPGVLMKTFLASGVQGIPREIGQAQKGDE